MEREVTTSRESVNHTLELQTAAPPPHSHNHPALISVLTFHSHSCVVIASDTGRHPTSRKEVEGKQHSDQPATLLPTTAAADVRARTTHTNRLSRVNNNLTRRAHLAHLAHLTNQPPTALTTTASSQSPAAAATPLHSPAIRPAAPPAGHTVSRATMAARLLHLTARSQPLHPLPPLVRPFSRRM